MSLSALPKARGSRALALAAPIVAWLLDPVVTRMRVLPQDLDVMMVVNNGSHLQLITSRAIGWDERLFYTEHLIAEVRGEIPMVVLTRGLRRRRRGRRPRAV
jgi:hypothetical protein